MVRQAHHDTLIAPLISIVFYKFGVCWCYYQQNARGNCRDVKHGMLVITTTWAEAIILYTFAAINQLLDV
jgi:hypothetical protein